MDLFELNAMLKTSFLLYTATKYFKNWWIFLRNNIYSVIHLQYMQKYVSILVGVSHATYFGLG